MTALLDLNAIRHDHPLVGVVAASIKLQRAGSEWKACCPFHNEKSPSFTIFDGGHRFHCFGCGASGDVLDFLQRVHGVNLREAADMLTGGNLPSVHVAPAPVEERADRIAEARAIWDAAVPAKDTLAQTYLWRRGIHMQLPPSLRFRELPYGRHGRRYPCLVASITDVHDDVQGVQRIFLSPDGRKADLPVPKLTLGKLTGGAVRLAPPAGVLLLAEGLEDAATCTQELGQTAWAALGTANLGKVKLPDVVNTAVICGDNDAAGRAAAEHAATAYASAWMKVSICYPPAPAKDWNEALMNEGIAA